MKAMIEISCEAHSQSGFTFCNGVKNIILDLEKIKGTKHYFDLIKYLDAVCKLFEGPCNKINIIKNAIYKLYEFEYINYDMYGHINYFYNIHSRCGLLLSLKLK